MTFLSWEKMALNILVFLQDVGSWVCIGAGIILIIFGIVFAVQRFTMTPAGAVTRIARRRYYPSKIRPILCFAVGGVLAFGGWTFVTDLTKHAYLQVLMLVVEEDPEYINNYKNIKDISFNEPTTDEVLAAFEESGGILAEGFKKSIEKIPDVLGSMNRILVRAGLSPVDENSVKEAIAAIMQINDETSEMQGKDELIGAQ